MPAALTRREWLRLSAGALLSLGVWPGRLRGADAPATHDFTFIAVNDLHALEEAWRPWFDEVVCQMKASAPTAEFCLLGGDLAEKGRARAINSDQGFLLSARHSMSRRGGQSRLPISHR
jgi:hypothetical protein